MENALSLKTENGNKIDVFVREPSADQQYDFFWTYVLPSIVNLLSEVKEADQMMDKLDLEMNVGEAIKFLPQIMPGAAKMLGHFNQAEKRHIRNFLIGCCYTKVGDKEFLLMEGGKWSYSFTLMGQLKLMGFALKGVFANFLEELKGSLAAGEAPEELMNSLGA